MKNAISGYRTVKVAFDDAAGQAIVDQTAQIAAPIDAFKAAIGFVEKREGVYAKLGASGAPDLTDASIIVTGALPFQIHVFTVTTVMATGNYIFVYVETVPTVDDVS